MITMNTKIFISAMLVLLIFSAMAAADTEQMIQAHINEKSAEWTAGHTSVSDLTINEKKALCGAKIKYSFKRPLRAPKKVGYPAAFDWHDIDGSDWMTPVRNQGSCGSCWAFGVIGAFEACINIQKNDPGYDVDLSEQQLVSSCCGAGSCSGGYPTGALSYIEGSGVSTEKCFPYQARNSKCTPCKDWKNESYKIEKYVYIDSDTDSYKWALQNYGPMVVVVKVPEDWFYYKSGVYSPVWTSNKFGWANHCVVLCGWNDSLSAWIIKNSWGKYWGNHGYAYVKYGTIEKYRYGYAIEKPIIPAPNPDEGGWIKPIKATASSMYSETLAPEKAIDGINYTYWFSKRYQPRSWIQFDLGEQKTVDAIKVRFLSYYVPQTIQVQESIDGTHWKNVTEQTITKGDRFVDVPFGKVKCQHIKIIEKTEHHGYSMLSEMSVHTCKDDVTTSSINLEYANGSIQVIPFSDDLVSVTMINDSRKVFMWWST